MRLFTKRNKTKVDDLDSSVGLMVATSKVWLFSIIVNIIFIVMLLLNGLKVVMLTVI